MFKRIETKDGAPLAFKFEGQTITATPEDSIASALLAAGKAVFRSTPVSGAERGPYCMMGICFECLVEVDGVYDRQACMMPVREGMVVRRQRRPSEEDFYDLL
ncbi:(2Fe-2S)-binding protein [Mesorhizobium sp. L-8-3]|uniref:(2Fe-2S)-binding protein n=1 Tax=Mesorhizobium sp. L-8-3 TaxID=2744522 RepID=UPI0019281B45|nr:(2Fe-2S)-binding protein [Mesorhizobium sp. L-8-3]BCH27878.1 (2Fe-2S)-binding protein [Mesorhizobium sp. L-8-3]